MRCHHGTYLAARLCTHKRNDDACKKQGKGRGIGFKSKFRLKQGTRTSGGLDDGPLVCIETNHLVGQRVTSVRAQQQFQLLQLKQCRMIENELSEGAERCCVLPQPAPQRLFPVAAKCVRMLLLIPQTTAAMGWAGALPSRLCL